ncbi:MAG: hypothetical protein ACKPKO_33385, partial [Candidatus Fonsibacter sp.]
YIKSQIIHAIRGTNKRWWEVVDAVVKDYNKNHVSRNTLMTPNDAGKKENQDEVQTQLESIRKSDNPQLRIDQGDNVRVIIKNKFEKGLHAGLERQGLYRRDRIKRAQRSSYDAHVVSTFY